MKINSSCRKYVLLLNFAGFIVLFTYLAKRGGKNIAINNQSYFIKTDSDERLAVNLEIKNIDMFSLPSKYERLYFGSSEAFIFKNICIEIDNNKRRYIAIYNARDNYFISFNKIIVLLSSQSINMTQYKYYKNFNMFFVKGSQFITFPVNMHHFYKDLAVDLYSVLQ